MSLLCQNCHRLGNSRAENQLSDLVRAKDPSVMFLVETWINETRLSQVQDRLKFKNKFIAPRRNKLGGLVVFLEERI